MDKIYTPKFIGSWYSYNYLEQAKSFLNDAPKISAKIIIVPHAGHKFSGYVLGDVYSRIIFNGINKIIMLCAFHKNLNGLVLPNFTRIVYDRSMRSTRDLATGYFNPTKKLDIDTDGVRHLSGIPGFFIDNNNYYNEEHSFELELPFILATAGNVKILPILVGKMDDYNNAAYQLFSLVDENTLIIVSTDFTHYGKNFGNTRNSLSGHKKFILKNDFRNFKAILNGDINNFTGYTVCGRNALILLMHLNKLLKTNGKLVAYETSADNEKDNSEISSVSYAGIIFPNEFRRGKNNLLKMYTIKRKYLMLMEKWDSGKINFKELLDGNRTLVPRFTLIILSKLFKNFAGITTDEMYNEIKKYVMTDWDNTKFGVFVTFEDFHRLQGCIGTFYDENKMNVIDTIILYTLKTIFEDTRFPDNALTSIKNYRYLYTSDRYRFKINYLEKSFPVDVNNFWNIYEPCKHGIVLKYRSRSATFLPMVMLDQGWLPSCTKNLTKDEKLKFEMETFGALIRKMGLNDSWDNWRKGKIMLYEGKEYGENFTTKPII